MTCVSFVLSRPFDGVEVRATNDGIVISADDPATLNPLQLRSLKPRNKLGWTLPDAVAILLEKGLASEDERGIAISNDDFLSLEDEGIADFADIAPSVPFALQVESSGAIGTPHLKIQYQFFKQNEPIPVERCGVFLRYRDQAFVLDRDTFRVVEETDRLNAMPSAEKSDRPGLASVAAIRDAALNSGVDLDRLLKTEKILIAPKLGVSIIEEGDGRITYVPEIEGVPSESLQRQFLASSTPESILSVTAESGERVRAVLTDEQRDAVRRMQKVRHIGGREKAKVLQNPQAIFDGVNSAVDLSHLSARVKGIGDFPFVARPYIRAGIFDDAGPRAGAHEEPAIGIRCTYADGASADVGFSSRDEFFEFYNQVREASQAGKSEIVFQGKHIPIDSTFVEGLDDTVKALQPRNTRERENAGEKVGKFLLIHTNEETLDFQAAEAIRNVPVPDLPRSLIGTLKPHQLRGFRWLHRNYAAGRAGCLLADDMGLGKTLQVLTFLAWLFERQDDVLRMQRRAAAPVLIIAPVILLENETWTGDMQRFFAGRGEVFGSPLILRDAQLKRLRIPVQGRETELGEPVLDLPAIASYRVVLTNYDTVTNYQHSFGRIPWSVVVTDEAQEYKTPSTKISHAVKSLNADFRIASTGTPVETRLLDVWNLFDFLQPGLLASAKEFSKQYDEPISVSAGAVGTAAILEPLKKRLGLGADSGFVIRRDKRELEGLPTKTDVVIKSPLSAMQRRIHKEAIAMLKSGRREIHPFKVLHMLVKAYQHPALLTPDERPSISQMLVDSPKLARTMDEVSAIRARGEKCLIFTRSIAMQQILAATIREKLGRDVGIVNGASTRKGETAGSRLSREKIIRRFRETPGFDALVLSPDVAGIGLTLTEANNVIHYGRWWNPAKEMQATDRVYRIGQEKPVNVYYPVSVDPLNEFETFDEKLDRLLTRRKALAADFLEPIPGEDQLGQDLLSDLEEDAAGREESVKPLTASEIRTLTWDRFEALVAAVEAASRKRVILTPKGTDGGADVIAIEGAVLNLIQCKHSRADLACDEDPVRETVAAVDFYRPRIGETAGFTTIQPVLVSSTTFTRAAKRIASECGVTLVDGAAIAERVKRAGVTFVEVSQWSDKRASTLAEVIRQIRSVNRGM